ncbi:MAG: ArsC/Spx/MgsR family protein [Pseudomonadota bacterium]
MRVWALKSCDTCRKAQRALNDAGQRFETIDVRADGVTREDLARFQARFGEALINRKSTTWRGLDDAQRSGDPIALLLDHPTLMKRPVIETDDGTLLLGWTAETRSALGL